jgi:hypothetical protein
VKVLRPEGELGRLSAPLEQPTLVRPAALAKVTGFRRVLLAFQIPAGALGVFMVIFGLWLAVFACGLCRWWSFGIYSSIRYSSAAGC